jgi:hypothetical protein
MKSLYFKGNEVSDEATKVCVLYDPKDGRVVHVHAVTVLPGGKEVTEAELELRTKAHATTLGRSVEGLKHLRVPLSAVRQGGHLKVDPSGTGLVGVASPPSRRELLSQHRKAKARG